jgi:uncharacterized protein (TIGR02145 family)
LKSAAKIQFFSIYSAFGQDKIFKIELYYPDNFVLLPFYFITISSMKTIVLSPRKLLCFFALLVISLFCHAQNSVTLVFTGEDLNGSHVKMNGITIQNLSRNWQETFLFPDTIYILNVGTGIDDIQPANEMKVMPNPFEGSTRVNVFSTEDEKAKILIVDINGKRHAEYTGKITSGDNYFDITLASPQTYILSIQTKSGIRSLKMVNVGHGGADRITYAGNNPQTVKVNIKGSSSHDFQLGDEMRYTGFAQMDDHLRQSMPVQQMQYTNEEISLLFEGYSIEVFTDSVSFADETTFICYGTVNTHGSGAVQAGFCWSIEPNPSLNDHHISSGLAEGQFNSVLTGMDTSTTYYIRAYAINGTDTAYGENIACTPIISSFTQTEACFIPDGVDCGNGCAHESSIEVSGYTPSATIQSAEDILYTRIKLEHSFIGDLYIALTCPNGQSVKIMNKYGNYGMGGSSNCASQIPTPWGWNWTADTARSSAFFGDAYDSSNGCDPADSANQMGTPWNYCWSNNTTNSFQYANGQGYVYESANITDGKVDSTNTANMTQVYHPDQPFSQLVGCPMNGTWSIKIIDGWAIDNGWVSEWEVAFRGRNHSATVENDPTITHPCQNITTVTDFDGNEYHTVAIGNQCWLKENMRTKRYSFNEMIDLGDGTSTSTAYYYLPENMEDTIAGYLYNWAAVMKGASTDATSTNHIRGICPYGWHVPKDAEWTQLIEYLSLRSEYVCGENTSSVAKSMAANTCWNSSDNICAVGHDTSSNNSTSFSAFPAGNAYGVSYDYGISANFWTATAYNSDFAYYYSLNYDNSFVERNIFGDKCNGMSVRCIRDEGVPVYLPSVSTLPVSNVTEYSALCGGQITSTGGATITGRGICWSTSPNPTVSDSHISDNSGLNTFTCSIDNLYSSTTYYVRAYATNVAGIAYGEQRSFTTPAQFIAVSTASVNDITCTSATCGGNVAAGNPFAVDAYGVCWSTSPNPTLANSHTVDGSGIGSFTCGITGLQPNTTYHVRAYAIYYSTDTVYGEQKSFFTPGALPTVTTAALSDITFTSVTCGGEVTYEGIAAVTARGVCWSTSPTPTANGNHTVDGSGMGNFTSYITDLQPNTRYYVRAYAINSVDTVYGIQRYFNTLIPMPEVSTYAVSDISYTTAVCGGDVTSEGMTPVTARGVCWSTSTNPTISDSLTIDSSGLGSFTSLLTGLQPNTQYYVRAYATNSDGTAYGVQRNFTTSVATPTVITASVSNITCTTATCGGDVTNEGMTPVTARGVCWSTSTYPTISDSLTVDSSGLGSFTSLLTGLQPSTHYYVRAYATNSAGTVYGTQRQFTTPVATPTVTTATVSDITCTTASCGGNVTFEGISTVTARGVCWSTSSNPTINDSLTVDSSGLGNFTSLLTGLQPNTHYYVRAYATNSAGTVYGTQRQFTTPVATPTVTTATVSNITCITASCGGNVTFEGISPVTARGVCWSTSPNPTISDSLTVDSCGLGSFTSLLTGLQPNTHYYVRTYATNSAGTVYGTQRQFTTRVATPAITTSEINRISFSSVTCGGNVSFEGLTSVTARGVCWSTSPNPTLEDNHTVDSNGLGSFTSLITGLQPYTQYYVRAYATNNSGTAYGNEVDFVSNMDSLPCPGTETIVDYDGNTYNTVQIGNQCWMRENLRTTHYANGDSIPLGINTSTSSTIAYRFYPNSNENNVSTYGYLYNWPAVMGGSPSSSSNPSGVQGICPNGWHVPSDSEWTQLTDYVSEQIRYVCGNDSINIAKALASTTYWLSSNQNCAVGNTPANNNATGFTAIPANRTHANMLGNYAQFWSSTEDEDDDDDAHERSLFYSDAHVGGAYTVFKLFGFSVRCLRD